MYREILLDQIVFSEYNMYGGNDVLKNLSKVNILIGKNNSGKSRFLRRVFQNKDMKFRITSIDEQRINDLIDNLRSAARITKARQNASNYHRQLDAAINIPNITHINSGYKFDKILSPAIALKNLYTQPNNGYSDLITQIENSTSKAIDDLQDAVPNVLNPISAIYIPTLRGLRPVQIHNESFDTSIDNYLSRCKKDYFNNIDVSNDSIFTGLHLYNATKKLLLGTREERKKIGLFEDFLKSNFFQGDEVNIVPRIDDDVLHIRIGDDEFPIHQLGDGIQSIIILTYPLFFNANKEAVVFIEEPETHLHPGLQRILIETMQREEFSKFQYFITTHSNNFLDITIDYENISVYTFIKKTEKKFEIENVSQGEQKVLELIGARSSSVFLSNCTIWVEGITDRLYLRKYFEIYQQGKAKKLKEDYHYSFVEYGGNNITHWSFLDTDDEENPTINVDRLCSKLFLITDKDGAGLNKNGTPNQKTSKKHERHLKLSERLKDRNYCLNCREIENLLTEDIIVRTIKIKEGNNGNLNFAKFNRGDYQNELLGNYIEKNVDGIIRKYAAASGTVSDKVNFCKTAISQIETIEDLSAEAIEICKRLYDFIAYNNK